MSDDGGQNRHHMALLRGQWACLAAGLGYTNQPGGVASTTGLFRSGKPGRVVGDTMSPNRIVPHFKEIVQSKWCGVLGQLFRPIAGCNAPTLCRNAPLVIF